MKVGGEGVETRVINGILQIRSASRMLGYLNADSPFDNEGWYDTKDVVEQKNDLYKVVGRVSDVINVGGLKFMASEVERMALLYPGISLVSAYPRQNPITGQHVEMTIQPVAGVELSKDKLMSFFKDNLQPHMVPKRIKIEVVTVGHRFKRI
jgi:acyl-CoA synthetase (AMP-forming)/AMP-acid ligase II